jgi:hypothetical protein
MTTSQIIVRLDARATGAGQASRQASVSTTSPKSLESLESLESLKQSSAILPLRTMWAIAGRHIVGIAAQQVATEME